MVIKKSSIMPQPNFFNKKSESFVIVDIGSPLRLLYVDLKGELKILAQKKFYLAPEKKEETLSLAINDFLKENSIQEKSAILSISLPQPFIKRVQLPVVPDSELANAIKWKVKEEASFDLDRSVLEYQIIDKEQKDSGASLLNVVCAASPEEEVRKWVLVLKQAGLNCVRAAFSPFGYSKIIEKYFSQGKDESITILHLGQETSYIVFYRNLKIDFFREIPVSINKLKESMKGTLVSVHGKFELTPEEIEEVLFNYGVADKDFVYKDKMSSSQALAMLRPILERLAQEIKRSITYYNSQLMGSQISKVYCAGEALRIPHIEAFLARELGLSLELIPVFDKIKLEKDAIVSESVCAYPALGLSLDYNDGINLLPREFRTEKIEKMQKISLEWAAIIAGIFLAVSYVLSLASVGAYQKRLDNAIFQLQSVSEIKQMKARLDAVSNFYLGVRKLDVPLGVILKKVSSIVPPNVIFNDFSFDAEQGRGTVTGYVKNADANADMMLTQFVSSLSSSGYFREAKIAKVTKELSQDMEILVFEINFTTK